MTLRITIDGVPPGPTYTVPRSHTQWYGVPVTLRTPHNTIDARRDDGCVPTITTVASAVSASVTVQNAQ